MRCILNTNKKKLIKIRIQIKNEFYIGPGKILLLEKISAKVIAIHVVIKYNITEIVPILPNVDTLLKFDTPLTIEKNTTGTISILSEDINKLPGISIKSIKNFSCITPR